ncbi:helix-turn-helix domain-containing protein [Flavobacterium sp. GSB-24]|uniref:helix-turn-helix domain-containing protein n=1 Tax=Flavobacterium sp. GSB-24 TaxID=2994319 RepID=UPI0024921E40|nr:helix-turn-helix domain-containing protein [Flavobacterium sp. GSB-24]BDU25134.1 DNA-binding protein [Flavobacterium sp. GSB-24]
MEKSILLHCISPEELKEMIREVFRTEAFEPGYPADKEGPEILLTRYETAALLRISLTSLWKWTKEQKLQSYGMGNRRYYKKNEVLQCLKTF